MLQQAEWSLLLGVGAVRHLDVVVAARLIRLHAVGTVVSALRRQDGRLERLVGRRVSHDLVSPALIVFGREVTAAVDSCVTGRSLLCASRVDNLDVGVTVLRREIQEELEASISTLLLKPVLQPHAESLPE